MNFICLSLFPNLLQLLHWKHSCAFSLQPPCSYKSHNDVKVLNLWQPPSCPKFHINHINHQDYIISVGWGEKNNVEDMDGSSVPSWLLQPSFPGGDLCPWSLNTIPPATLQALSWSNPHGPPLPFLCQRGCKPDLSPQHPAELRHAPFVFYGICPISSTNRARTVHSMVSFPSNLVNFHDKNCQCCSSASVSPQKWWHLWDRSQIK